MIQTIRIGRLLRETVTTPYRNLVTRPTGAAVRDRIEAALARSDCHTALLDFSDVELLDFSCADEVVAKLLLAEAARRRRFVVLRGLRDEQHEAIEHVLDPPRLAVAALLRRGGALPARLGDAPTRGRRSTRLELGRALRRRAGGGPGLAGGRAREALAGAGPHRLVRPDGDLRVPAARRMTPRRLGLSTTAIHGMPRRRPDWTPVVPPIVQSSTFTNPVGSEEEVLYTRYGNNPTQVALAKKYALLEGAEDAHLPAPAAWARRRWRTSPCSGPGDHLDQQRLDLRRHPAVLRRGVRPPGDRGDVRRPDQPRALAQGGPEDHPRDLRRDPDQSADAGARPGADRPRGAGVRARAAGGRDLRQPDQLPPAGARGGRGDHQRHQVPQRPQRRHRRRGGGLRLVRRGGATG